MDSPSPTKKVDTEKLTQIDQSKPLDSTARILENLSFIEEEVNFQEDPATGRRTKANRAKYMLQEAKITSNLSMN